MSILEDFLDSLTLGASCVCLVALQLRRQRAARRQTGNSQNSTAQWVASTTMASASGYNHMRFARSVLKKSRKWEPSLVVQLYATHWRFESSITNFRYDGPMKPFLLALRAQAIPASLIPTLYDLQPPVSFIDGCLVVEIQDFRLTTSHTNPYSQTASTSASPAKSQPPVTEPVKTRVVMRPTSETLAETIELMIERKGDHWGDGAALDLEARILAATSPPLYLGTSIIAARAAALSLALTAPARPNIGADGTYRHGGPEGSGEDKGELDRLRKVLSVGDTMRKGGFQPSYAILRAKDTLANRAFFDPSRPGSSRVTDAAPGSVASSQHPTLPAGSPSSGDADRARIKKADDDRTAAKKKKKLTADQAKLKKKRVGEDLVDEKPTKKNATKKAKTAASSAGKMPTQNSANAATIPAPFARPQASDELPLGVGLGNFQLRNQGSAGQAGWARG